MTEHRTDYGRLIVGAKEDLFAKAVSLVAEQEAKTNGKFSWAFTGGSVSRCAGQAGLSPADTFQARAMYPIPRC